MPIKVQQIDARELHSEAEVHDWVKRTEGDLCRLPVADVLEAGAMFVNDEYLDGGGTRMYFNVYGFRSFCKRISYRYDHLDQLEKPGLASEVVNDLIRKQSALEKLHDADFVLDKSNSTVVGVVSRSYLEYRNGQFLQDMEALLKGNGLGGGFTFHNAYGVNTELTVRYIFREKHGTISGSGGQGDDVSKIGLEFRNSMVGTSSVRIDNFFHRLVCANGMTVPVNSTSQRVNHSGHRDTFQKRLSRCFDTACQESNSVIHLIRKLGDIELDFEQLAENRRASELIWDIIPGSKQSIRQHIRQRYGIELRNPKNSTTDEGLVLKHQHDTLVMKHIPECYADESTRAVFESSYRDGATMFDFVNVFTAYAKGQQPTAKLEIEEKAGKLAKYIAVHIRSRPGIPRQPDRRTGEPLARAIEVWNLSQAEMATLFDVSYQASMAADFVAATDLLVHYLRRDRIPAVVRRPIPALDGTSLLDLLKQRDTQALLTACRDMFRFERAYD